MALAKKAHEQPRHLTPADLDPLRAIVGAGALDYAFVLGSFHFINRMADLLDVSSEALPAPLRRLELVRRLATRLQGILLRKMMNLENRAYGRSYEEVVAAIAPAYREALGCEPGEAFARLRERPQIIEALQLMLEERLERSSLQHTVMVDLHRIVEEALPNRPEDLEGFHERPADPVHALAFVGTRYASRTTKQMIDALRLAGYDDLGILDLAIAIADANNWARLRRLTGLSAGIGCVAV